MNNRALKCELERHFGDDCILCGGIITVHHMKGVCGGKKIQTTAGTVLICEGLHRLINELCRYDKYNEVIIDQFFEREKVRRLIK